jgi:hypothetical protein
MILLRSFRCDDDGDVVTDWYEQMAARQKARARLDSRMTYLRQQPREGWVRPIYDTLRDGVGEVRFKIENTLYRPIGFFGPGRNEFTFLLFATKADKFDPINAIDVAVERKSILQKDPQRAVKVTRWGQK